MALIAGIVIIVAILTLFGALALRWGVDSRESWIDSYTPTPHAGMR